MVFLKQENGEELLRKTRRDVCLDKDGRRLSMSWGKLWKSQCEFSVGYWKENEEDGALVEIDRRGYW